jgi:hypothetical protein
LVPTRNVQAPSISTMPIAAAPLAIKYATAPFVSGNFAGRAWPISTSVIVMGERNSGDRRRRQSEGDAFEQFSVSVVLLLGRRASEMMIDPEAKLLVVLDTAEEYRALRCEPRIVASAKPMSG